MARIGQVEGNPEPVVVSTAEGSPVITLWCGLEATDLSPDAADQLAAFLKVAAARVRR